MYKIVVVVVVVVAAVVIVVVLCIVRPPLRPKLVELPLFPPSFLKSIFYVVFWFLDIKARFLPRIKIRRGGWVGWLVIASKKQIQKLDAKGYVACSHVQYAGYDVPR
ncbi:hypothetical protein F5Y11DRAFT_276792 [Daldinia sp. FL1419]|nr:hypothetical protein F5Y11DRAFT_276792 [Daldinia sp. FL1419]